MYDTLRQMTDALKAYIIPNSDWYIMHGQQIGYTGFKARMYMADYHKPLKVLDVRATVYVYTVYMDGRISLKEYITTVQEYVKQKKRIQQGVDTPKNVWWLHEVSDSEENVV